MDTKIKFKKLLRLNRLVPLEKLDQERIEKSNKRILHYFLYTLPSQTSFEFLYHVYNPVRYAVETFDSIEEIKKEQTK